MNEQARKRVSDMIQKKRLNENDIKLLVTFYNLCITQLRKEATTYKQEEDSLPPPRRLCFWQGLFVGLFVSNMTQKGMDRF